MTDVAEDGDGGAFGDGVENPLIGLMRNDLAEVADRQTRLSTRGCERFHHRARGLFEDLLTAHLDETISAQRDAQLSAVFGTARENRAVQMEGVVRRLEVVID